MTGRSREFPGWAVWAAGAAVRRSGSDGTEYLLVHRPRYDDWSLPKGKLDPGERFEDAAVREIAEETGVVAELGPSLGTVAYATAQGPKVVRYWLMDIGDAPTGAFEPDHEVDDVRWIDQDGAAELLSYDRDREVLAAAERITSAPQRRRVYLVRHGYAGSRDAWGGDDDLRPLTPDGRDQAFAIADWLTARPVTGVATSPAERCRQTLRPYARDVGLDLVDEPRLREDRSPEDVLELLGEHAGPASVVCTHGEVVEDLVGKLAAEGVELIGDRAWEKGSIWVLDLVGRRVERGRYVSPLA